MSEIETVIFTIERSFMQSSGYSGTPLAKKLGIREGHVILIRNAPPGYMDLFEDFPDHVIISKRNDQKKDLIHFFVTRQEILLKELDDLKNSIVQNGCIWISWPKKISKVDTDITEDVIRNIALNIGLVDIKVCAVDDTWSGLKLVIPVKYRK